MKNTQIFILTILSFCFLKAQFSAELVAKGFDKPIFVTSSPDNSEILYIGEQKGIIQKIENGMIDETPFLNLRKRVHQPLFPGDEMGFLGFAFHPDYPKNDLIFVHYNDRRGNTIVSKINIINGIGDNSTERIILELEQPYSNHNGGSIEFGPDGYLYISLGDGGSAGDPENRAQNTENLLGSILRIDINVDEGYAIPQDNPFVNNDNSKHEIWAWGLRNAWRFSFDRLNGDMYMGDVGQNKWEEINWIKNGDDNRNFGWKVVEGMHCYPKEDSQCDKNLYVSPIFEYPNDANYVKTILGIKQHNLHGCSVTGGYVYRGHNIPDIYGRYFFGDYCTGKVWSFINNKGVIEDFQDHSQLILDAIGKKEFYLSSFGEDSNGELYLIDYNGSIYKIIQLN